MEDDAYIALVVSIPKDINLETIRAEVSDAIDMNLVLNHKLGNRKPKYKPKYIFIVHDGVIRVIGNLIGYEYKEFDCESTGEHWDNAWYAVFDKPIIFETSLIEYSSFRGFRYMTDLSYFSLKKNKKQEDNDRKW